MALDHKSRSSLSMKLWGLHLRPRRHRLRCSAGIRVRGPRSQISISAEHDIVGAPGERGLLGGERSEPRCVAGFGGERSEPRCVIRFGGERSEPRCDIGFGGERSEPRCVTGYYFVRLILSYALGFVRVIFPRASSVGFSLCTNFRPAEVVGPAGRGPSRQSLRFALGPARGIALPSAFA